MKTHQSLAIVLSLSVTGLCAATTGSNDTLIVSAAPDYVRPYVLPKFIGPAVLLTERQSIRFSVTGNASDGALALIQHNGPASNWLSSVPHSHHEITESFYCSRGRFQLWTAYNGTGVNTTAIQESRIMTVGDYGMAIPNTVHTFRMQDPDSEITHVFAPAGVERIFQMYSQGDFVSPLEGAPYLPKDTEKNPFSVQTPEQLAQLAEYDLFKDEAFIPTYDLVNGSTSPGWHEHDETLPEALNETTSSYFVAKGYGPKYLHTSAAGYQLIQPLSTSSQSSNLTQGTITLSPKLANETVHSVQLPNHYVMMVQEGLLVLDVQGYPTVEMMQGDVAFLPANTNWTYYAKVPFTQFMYINAGSQGLDAVILPEAKEWDLITYPQYPASV